MDALAPVHTRFRLGAMHTFRLGSTEGLRSLACRWNRPPRGRNHELRRRPMCPAQFAAPANAAMQSARGR